MHIFGHRLHWHHFALALGALMVGASFIIAYANLNVGTTDQQYEPGVPDASIVKQGDCRPTGCSGEICSDQDVASTCIYKPEFECYKTAVCERGSGGKCGWRATGDLTQCLSQARAGR